MCIVCLAPLQLRWIVAKPDAACGGKYRHKQAVSNFVINLTFG